MITSLTAPGVVLSCNAAVVSCRGDQHPGCLVQHLFSSSVRGIRWFPAAVPQEVFPEKEAAVSTCKQRYSFSGC